MKNGWSEVSLDSITQLIKRGVSPKYVESDGYPIINQKCIRDGFVSLQHARMTSKAKKITSDKFVRSGDVLINSTGTGTLGRTAIVKSLNQDTTVDTHVTIVRANELVDKYFLGYLIRYYEPLITSLGKGATNQIELSRRDLEATKVKIPTSKVTQRKISDILSAYDDLIENNTKRIELLEEQAQLIYEEWFVRMRFPNHENIKINAETGLPEGWKVSTIEELSEVKGGKRLPKGHSLTSEKTSYPYIRVRDLTSGRMNIDEIQFINHDTHIKIKNYIINHTDLYISIAGTVGLVGMVPKTLDSANLTENCAKITNLISEDIKEYLHYFLNSESGQHHISSRTGGASQPKLAIERIRSIPTTVPNDEILAYFHNSVSVINDLVENLLIQSQKLKEARDILLPRLMTGIIEV